MAGVGLLALLDDIATVLDDVAILTKVAARKTAGVLGDDLALNAQQVAGVRAEREIPVVWAVAKGSAKNKLILVPVALGISAVAHWAITPLLMLGGAYLCFEGFEKIAHKMLHSHSEDEHKHNEKIQALSNPDVDLVVFEKNKIKGAIRTDFILSAEIIVIALGTVQSAPFVTQVIVVAAIAAIMTVGVYSVVAGIVKLDDAGMFLMDSQESSGWGKFKRALGAGVLAFCPYLMKTLSVVGTAAMFLVGGGILVHGIPFIYNTMHHVQNWVETIPMLGGPLAVLTPSVLNALLGVIAGALVLAGVSIGKRFAAVFNKS
jgi:uncharacterized protein